MPASPSVARTPASSQTASPTSQPRAAQPRANRGHGPFDQPLNAVAVCAALIMGAPLWYGLGIMLLNAAGTSDSFFSFGPLALNLCTAIPGGALAALLCICAAMPRDAAALRRAGEQDSRGGGSHGGHRNGQASAGSATVAIAAAVAAIGEIVALMAVADAAWGKVRHGHSVAVPLTLYLIAAVISVALPVALAVRSFLATKASRVPGTAALMMAVTVLLVLRILSPVVQFANGIDVIAASWTALFLAANIIGDAAVAAAIFGTMHTTVRLAIPPTETGTALENAGTGTATAAPAHRPSAALMIACAAVTFILSIMPGILSATTPLRPPLTYFLTTLAFLPVLIIALMTKGALRRAANPTPMPGAPTPGTPASGTPMPAPATSGANMPSPFMPAPAAPNAPTPSASPMPAPGMPTQTAPAPIPGASVPTAPTPGDPAYFAK